MSEKPLLRLDIVTIFPDYLAPLHLSLVGKAIRAGVVDLGVHDLRQWATDRHHSVDDIPYGGGAGMVMTPQPWADALTTLASSDPSPPLPVLIIPTPSGEVFTQAMAAQWAQETHLVMACGRYEGIDARVAQWAQQHFRVQEVSLGDFVLAGGEAAALVMAEAVIRLLPDVLGNPASLVEESHALAIDSPDRSGAVPENSDQASSLQGLLEYPVYTRPAVWQGWEVPPVLLSGDHPRVARWRREQALRRTAIRRPDLLRTWLSHHATSLTRQERQLVLQLTHPQGDHCEAAMCRDVAD